MHPIAIQLAFVAVAVVLVAVATLLRALWSEVSHLNRRLSTLVDDLIPCGWTRCPGSMSNRRLSTLADDLTELGKAKVCPWADHDAKG